LGDRFGIDHNLGAEVFGISPQNFRVKLYRSRRDPTTTGTINAAWSIKPILAALPKRPKRLTKWGL